MNGRKKIKILIHKVVEIYLVIASISNKYRTNNLLKKSFEGYLNIHLEKIKLGPILILLMHGFRK